MERRRKLFFLRESAAIFRSLSVNLRTVKMLSDIIPSFLESIGEEKLGVLDRTRGWYIRSSYILAASCWSRSIFSSAHLLLTLSANSSASGPITLKGGTNGRTVDFALEKEMYTMPVRKLVRSGENRFDIWRLWMDKQGETLKEYWKSLMEYVVQKRVLDSKLSRKKSTLQQNGLYQCIYVKPVFLQLTLGAQGQEGVYLGNKA